MSIVEPSFRLLQAARTAEHVLAKLTDRQT